MPVSLLLLIAVVTGLFVAFQGLVNSQLGIILSHPYHATFISFFVGTLAMVVFLLITGIGFPDIAHLKRAPWYLFLGGVMGGIFVTVALILVPKLGVASVVMGMFVGQIIASMLIDHFGLLGSPQIVLEPNRMIGAGLMIAGLWFINQKVIG